MKTAMMILVALMIPISVCGMQDDRLVDGSDLRDGAIYFLRQPSLDIQLHWRTTRSGVIRIFKGSILKIEDRHRDGETLWYLVRNIQPRTLDHSREIRGWFRASDIHKDGLYFDHVPPV